MATKRKPKEAPEDAKKCENCIHGRFEPGDELGYCHRYPPVLLQQEDGEIIYSFAIVPAAEFCGEYCRRTS